MNKKIIFLLPFLLGCVLVTFSQIKKRSASVNLITNSSFNIYVDGKVDGLNSKYSKLYSAGGYPDVSELSSFEPLDTIEIENADTIIIDGITVLSNESNNIYHPDSLLKAAFNYPGGLNINDSVFSLYNFVSEKLRYFFVPELEGTEAKNVMKNFGVYGVGHCGSFANCIVLLAEKSNGNKNRWWSRTDGGHGWAEVKFGNKWFFVDADERSLIRDIDNKNYISYQEYANDLYLGLRDKILCKGVAPSYSFNTGIYFQLSHHSPSPLYFTDRMINDFNANSGKGLIGNALNYNLKPGEKLIITNKQDNVLTHQLVDLSYGKKPDTNDVLKHLANSIYILNVLDSKSSSKKFDKINNINFNLTGDTLTGFSNGYGVVVKNTEFPIVESRLTMSANCKINDTVEVFFSVDSINWIKKAQLTNNSSQINALLFSNLECNARTALYKAYFLFKFKTNSSIKVTNLVFNNTIQQTKNITPSLISGNNTIRITSNNLGQVKVKTIWQEDTVKNPPLPPISPVYPLNNSIITKTDSVHFTWLPQFLTSNGDSITEWYFELSDDSIFTKLLCGQFSQFSTFIENVSKNKYFGYKNYAEAFNLFNHNQSYYWRVKIKGQNGLWSTYSPVWQFKTFTSQFPINVHFQKSVDSTSLNLTWSNNNFGSNPIRYNIYKSDNFYVSPYSFWLDTSILVSKPKLRKVAIPSSKYYRIAAVSDKSSSAPSRLIQVPKSLDVKYGDEMSVTSILDSLRTNVSNYPANSNNYFVLFDPVYFNYDSIDKKLRPKKIGSALVSFCYVNPEINYDTIYQKQILYKIKKANLQVVANPCNLIYGQFATNKGYIINGLKFTDTVNLNISLLFDSLNILPVGNHPIIILGDTETTNYYVSYTNSNISVAKKELYVFVDTCITTYGAPIILPNIKYDGFVNNETPLQINVLPTISILQNQYTSVGVYPISIQNGLDNNYNLIVLPSFHKIVPRVATLKPLMDTVEYGTLPNLHKFVVSGFVNGDDTSVLITKPVVYTFATIFNNVGNYIIYADSAISTNYVFDYDTSTLYIRKAILSLIANDTTITYGVNPVDNGFNLVGLKNNDNSSVLLSNVSYIFNCDNFSNVGTYQVTPYNATATNYEILFYSGTINIKKKELIFSANVSTSVYGDVPVLTGYQVSGFVNNDQIVDLDALPQLLLPVNQLSPTGIYTISFSSATDANYEFVYANNIHQVLKRVVYLQPNYALSTYGDALTNGYTINGLVNGDQIIDIDIPPTLTTTATNLSPVGLYTITASNADDSNYSFIYSTNTHEIIKAPLTVIAKDTFCLLNYILFNGYDIIGFVNTDNIDSIDVLPALSTTANINSVAGIYPIIPENAFDNNYYFNYVNGVLNVGKVPLYVTPNDTICEYGNINTNGFAITGFISDDDIDSLKILPTCSTAATNLSNTGVYDIVTSGGFDDRYFFEYNKGKLNIVKAPILVSVADTNSIYGSINFNRLSFSGFKNTDDVLGLDNLPILQVQASNLSNVGNYVAYPYGGSDNNYYFNYDTGSNVILKANLIIIPKDTICTYGNIVLNGYQVFGFKNNDNIDSLDVPPILQTNASSTSPVSSGYFIAASLASDFNYDFTYLNGTINITKALLVVKPIDTSCIYGNIALPNYLISGFLNSDTKDSIDILPYLNSTASSFSNVGSYIVYPLGALDNNYFFRYDTSSLIIIKANLDFIILPDTSIYGTTPQSSKFVINGFQNNETIFDLDSIPLINLPVTSSTNVGSYPLYATNVLDTNYTFTIFNSAHAVIPKALYLKLKSLNLTYGDTIPQFVYTAIGFVNGDTFNNIDNLPIVQSNIVPQASTGIYFYATNLGSDNNYALIHDTADININKATLDIIIPFTETIYGSTISTPEPIISGFKYNDTKNVLSKQPSITIDANQQSDAGLYISKILDTAITALNYKIIFVDNIHKIVKRDAFVVLNDTILEYNQRESLNTFSISNMLFGQTLEVIDQLPSFNNINADSMTTGEYQVYSINGFDNNYNLVDDTATKKVIASDPSIMIDFITINEIPNIKISIASNGGDINKLKLLVSKSVSYDTSVLEYIEVPITQKLSYLCYDTLISSINYRDHLNYFIKAELQNSKGKFYSNELKLLSYNEDVVVFPNPSSKMIFVSCPINFSNINLKLINSNGQILLNEDLSTFSTELNVTKYPKGTYLIKVSSNEGTITKKVVIN
jgi:hypothetical protein